MNLIVKKNPHTHYHQFLLHRRGHRDLAGGGLLLGALAERGGLTILHLLHPLLQVLGGLEAVVLPHEVPDGPTRESGASSGEAQGQVGNSLSDDLVHMFTSISIIPK